MDEAFPPQTDDLRELVAAIKHDLGKYVAWTSANLPEEAWSEPASPDLVAALITDLLQTRKGRDGTVEAAWEVWARLAGELSRPWPPELEAVDAAVQVLREAEPALRTKDAGALGRMGAQLKAAQTDIRAHLRSLHRRLAN